MYFPTLDAVSNAHVDSATNSISWIHVLGSGHARYLIVGIQARTPQGQENNSILSSISINGVPLRANNPYPDGYLYQSPSQINHQRQRLSVWVLDLRDLPPAGSYTISATFNTNVDWCLGIAGSFNNLAIGNGEALNSGGYTSAGGSGSVTVGLSTITPNALVVEITGCANGSSWTPGGGQTLATSVSANGALVMTYKVVTTPASITMQETNSNAESLAMIVMSMPFRSSPKGAIISIL